MKKILISLLAMFMVIAFSSNEIHISALENKTWEASQAFDKVENNMGSWQGIDINATASGAKFAPRGNDIQINANTVLSIPVDQNSAGAELTLFLSGGNASVTVLTKQYDSQNGKVVISLQGQDTGQSIDVCFISQAYVNSIVLTYLEEYPGEPGKVEVKDKDYQFTDDQILKNENNEIVNQIEQTRGTYDDILVDATNGKFAVQPQNCRVQINAGTKLYIPVTHDENGTSLTVSGTVDGSTPITMNVNGDEVFFNSKIVLDIDKTSYIEVSFDQSGYVSLISIDYGSDLGYGEPAVNVQDKVWDLTASSAISCPSLQGQKGEYDGIQIDALSGKFSPRDGDCQVNGGTVFYLPVAADDEIYVQISGNNYSGLTVYFDGQEITIGKEFAIKNETARYIPLEFKGEGSCYLTQLSIDYSGDNVSISHSVRVGKSSQAQYQNIQDALENEVSSAAEPLIIDIEPGIYQEKIEINQAYVTLRSLSADPQDVVIKHHYYSSNTFNSEGQFVPQDEYDAGTDKSGTIIVNSAGTGFTMYNITVENSYNIEEKTGINKQTPAVALCTNADKIYLNNCRVIGRQDTLYVKGTGNRVYLLNSYIEGTVDFIFGDADAYFDNCQLHMAYYQGKKNGYYTAPNTKTEGIGLVFYNCKLTADAQVQEVSLGRPWQNECHNVTKVNDKGETVVVERDTNRKKEGYENISSATTFINCQMTQYIQDQRWNQWTRKTADGKTVNVTYEKTVRFNEYNSLDEQGQKLNPDEYDVVLGKMIYVDDIEKKRDETLSQMRIGNELGAWLPDLSAYQPDYVKPPVEEEISDTTQSVVSGSENASQKVLTALNDMINNPVSQSFESANESANDLSNDESTQIAESDVPLSSGLNNNAKNTANNNQPISSYLTIIIMVTLAFICIVLGWFGYKKLIK